MFVGFGVIYIIYKRSPRSLFIILDTIVLRGRRARVLKHRPAG